MPVKYFSIIRNYVLSVSSQRKYNFYLQKALVDAFRTNSRNIIGRNSLVVMPLLANQDLTPMLLISGDGRSALTCPSRALLEVLLVYLDRYDSSSLISSFSLDITVVSACFSISSSFGHVVNCQTIFAVLSRIFVLIKISLP